MTNLVSRLSTGIISFVGEDSGTGTTGITNAINNLTTQGYTLLCDVTNGIAVIAVVCVLIKMIVASDGRTVSQCKMALIVICISVIAIHLAPNCINWVESIANSVAV